MTFIDPRDKRIAELEARLEGLANKLNERSASPKRIPPISDIPEGERTPLVVALLEIVHLQQERIQALEDEIAKLKGHKPRPTIKPSALERPSDRNKKKRNRKKRPGSKKRRKTERLKIHEVVVISPDSVPEGSRFKGYDHWTVQEIVIRPNNTLYRLERWKTPSGEYVVGKVPKEVEGSHFGSMLVSFVLYQYHHAHVTQPLIHEQLLEFGFDISVGKVNDIITENKDRFHAEKDEILRAGLEVSRYIHVDDTGARHKGRNGYCTHIGNELFAWFASTESKSRINFLRLLRGELTDYVLNDEALEYMRTQKLPSIQRNKLAALDKKVLRDEVQWKACLEGLNITTERHVRIVTEGGLLGSILEHGLNPELAIVSDDAGQFNVLLHALCWIHAERTINKLVGFNEDQRKALTQIRSQIWDFYDELNAYKEQPLQEKKTKLESRFDELFTTKICFVSLKLALKRLHKNKSELLLVLHRPDIPLHNNLSERDIREFVKKRKISGSTRNDNGRRCRDTFASLKKTCRKLGIPFWVYLKDRVFGHYRIPTLADLIRQQERAPPTQLGHQGAG